MCRGPDLEVNHQGACLVQLTVIPADATVAIPMSLAQRSLSLAGIVGILTAVFAAGLIYLLVTQPVSTAENIAQGEVSPSFARWPACWRRAQGNLKFLR